MKKKFFTIILMFLVITGCSVSDGELKDYVQYKHNAEVDIVSRPKIDTGNGGRSSFRVKHKDIPEFRFSVFVDGLFFNRITGDNYKESLEFYEFNQEYMESDLHEKFKKLGFEKSFLQLYTTDDEDGFKGSAYLFLFKPGGIGVDEQDYALLQQSYPLIQEVKQTLAGLEYDLYELYVYDVNAFNRFFLNENDSKDYKIMNEVSIYKTDIEKMNTVERVKEAIFSDSLNREKLISYHFFKKEEQKVAERMPELNKLGFEPDEGFYYGFVEPYLFCLDGSDDYVSYESINIDACQSYDLNLQTKGNLSDMAEENKQEQIMQMLSIVKSVNLPINNVRLKVMDGKYVDFISLEDIQKISDIRALEAALEEQVAKEEQ
ncbi:hypothetical protein [Mesobacillus jeotgali]|uniref:hypothetical protein n=1 Tax=Mesobacillus jeotgali TaxID=129985 RepID=UPI0009A6EC3D|nr:hypothetical protein [Mesobacillus jeotgali]